MNRFRNISLIYECDASTLKRAALLAKDNGAQLTIVYPIREIPSGVNLIVGRNLVDVRKLVLREHETRMEEAVKSAETLGVQAASRMLCGDPAIEIIRDVIEQKRDLVVLTAEGEGGFKEFMFGTLATRLVRECPSPVLVLKPSPKKQFKRILAAIDPIIVGYSRDTLNDAILKLASSLSAGEGAELHIVHAWTVVGESLLRDRGGNYAAEINRHVEEEGKKRRELIENLLAGLSVTEYKIHLLKGDASTVIPQLVTKLEIDVLVMGTVCRTGIPGFIIGNTAERVLSTVDCSVFTLKPEGFVSPIAPLISG